MGWCVKQLSIYEKAIVHLRSEISDGPVWEPHLRKDPREGQVCPYTYDIQKPLTMSTNCPIDSDSKLALCDNCNYIGNPFKFRSFRKPPLKPSHRTIISLMLFICGDVEMNPGPGNSSIYPCGFCDCKVSWTDKGVCCDDCSIWYHKSCISMPSTDYDNLEDFSWHCIMDGWCACWTCLAGALKFFY